MRPESKQGLLGNNQTLLQIIKKYLKPGNIFENEIALFILILTGFFFSFFVLTYHVYDFFETKNKQEFTIKNEIVSETQKATIHINEYLRDVERIADHLASKISSGEIKKSEIAATLRDVHDKHRNIMGISVVYAPYRYSPNIDLYAPYSLEVDGQQRLVQLEDSYKYNEQGNINAEWYFKGMDRERVWNEPRYGLVAKAMVIRYTIRFYDNIEDRNAQRNPAGIIFFNCSQSRIRKIMGDVDLGQTGYCFILSKDKQFVYHPDKDLTHKATNIESVFENPQYQNLRNVEEALDLHKPNEVFSVVDPSTGQMFWHTYQNTDNEQWKLVTNFPVDDIAININKTRRIYIDLILYSVLFLTFLFALLYRVYNIEEIKWNFPISISIVLITSVFLIWYCARTYAPPQELEKKMSSVFNHKAIDQFIKIRKEEASVKDLPEPVFIPTGLYIETIKMENTSDVTISGRVWNVVPKGNAFPIKKDSSKMYTKGVSFINTVASSITPYLETVNEDSSKTINSRFTVTIRQYFDYTNYPFDYKGVATALQYVEPNKNVVLIPDLESYLYTNPSAKPGVDKNIVMSEYNFKSSFFFTLPVETSTSFGLKNNSISSNTHAMGVCMKLDRSILSSFVSFLLPYFVIIFLLFTLLLTMEETQRSGFLGSAAGLLFTVLLSHYSLRTALQFDKIVYFEYLFFLTYVVIMLLVLNAFLYFSDVDYKLIKYKNNFYIKLSYWPFVLFAQLVLTFLIYY